MEQIRDPSASQTYACGLGDWPMSHRRAATGTVRYRSRRTYQADTPLRATRMERVYPRVYGEAAAYTDSTRCPGGLSPRVRGSLEFGFVVLVHWWSIPACTGKPRDDRPTYHCRRVYPRVYGEAIVDGQGVLHLHGLSPRVRGSLEFGFVVLVHWWSIPAPTEKPVSYALLTSASKVYPRAYGEANTGQQHQDQHGGLSPRLRGSRLIPSMESRGYGSIPAPTGKPP